VCVAEFRSSDIRINRREKTLVKEEIKYVYINGELVPPSEAKVSCFDEGLTHGWAVYEGIRVYDGKVLHLDAHIDRLFDSAKAAFIKVPLTKKEFREAIIKTVKANGFKNSHIMPWVSYGVKGGTPTVVIPARPAESVIGKEVKAMVSAIRRTSCDSIDPKIKTNSRLDLCLAGLEARRVGVDYAIMLDKDGFVAEASMANLFLTKNGKTYTPYTTHALAGITRDNLMQALKEKGIPVEERNLTIQDLYVADEILICGTGAELRVVTEIDGRVVGNGKTGDISRTAINWYLEHIKEAGEPLY
jgi:branched-chain amino acid aminotransferase